MATTRQRRRLSAEGGRDFLAEAKQALLETQGIEMPADTTEENFLRDLVIALTARGGRRPAPPPAGENPWDEEEEVGLDGGPPGRLGTRLSHARDFTRQRGEQAALEQMRSSGFAV